LASIKAIIQELKVILESSNLPLQLDDHPWAKSLLVRQFVDDNPSIQAHDPGRQLLSTITAIFCEMMPSVPPRRGKRLDTDWGQFGILAALYFAPYKFGTPRPTKLRDAWGRIDQVIPLYVFGKPAFEVPPVELDPYKLVSDENEVAPTSTISDWHVKGLEKLAQIIIEREELLSVERGEPSVFFDPIQGVDISEKADLGPTSKIFEQARFLKWIELYRHHKRGLWTALIIILVLLLGWKAVRIYTLAREVKKDVDQLQAVVSLDASPIDNLSLDSLIDVGPLLSSARIDVLTLQSELAPFIWVGKLVAWMPIYGGDAAAAGDLLDLASGLLIAGDEGFQAAEPLLSNVEAGEDRPTIPEILDVLVAAQPRIAIAQEAIQDALAARAAIDSERLSPITRPLLEKIDPFLPLLKDGVDALGVIPVIMGTPEYGPQTYLILIQNEDEIRATGGFITAVASVTVDQGQIIGFKAEDSYAVDDFSRMYPSPPWQYQQYMYIGYLLLRDSNWSPDFPTSATWAEHLYAYYSAHSVDGVIAIDQEVIRLMLTVLPPLEIVGLAEPVNANNVFDLMQNYKDQFRDDDPERKGFMGLMASALLERIQGSSDFSWQALGAAIIQGLNEKHIQVQMDDPILTNLLSSRGWDGAVHPGEADFLMVVDTNMGYNKANAMVTTEFSYEVSLSDMETPVGHLTVTHTNHSPGNDPCVPGPNDVDLDYIETAERCYWNYLRVYTLTGTKLLDAIPHAIPGEWLVTGYDVPARVDVLDNNGIVPENPAGVQAYGTLVVIPRSEQRQTSFDFALVPDAIQTAGANTWVYQLRIQKQAGTINIPLALRIHLPKGAQVVSSNPSGMFRDGTWQADLALRTDLEIFLMWQMP
jgi:hypothetical protein